MAGLSQDIIFTGGENSDVDNRLMPPTDWRYSLNCRSGNNEKDAAGTVENIQGNVLIEFTLPAGENRCIGRGKDDKASIFYFVYNNLGNHCILRYRIDTNAIERVVYPTPQMDTTFLNFKNDTRYRIWHVDVINLSDNQEILSWTDGWVEEINIPYDETIPADQQSLKSYNPPRTLNITLATNFQTGNTPQYPASFGAKNPRYQNQYTDRIKYPPLLGPGVGFGDDQTRNTNYFRGKPLPQFRYRYVYLNNQKSTWSPISRVARPLDDESILGVATYNYWKNNFVRITYLTGHESAVQIEFAVRFGNTGNWFLFDTLNKYDMSDMDSYPFNALVSSDTVAQIDFYNDALTGAVAEQDLINYSSVPIVAGATRVIQDNRIADGNIIQDYDPVQLNISSSVNIHSVDTWKSLFSDQPQWRDDGWYVLPVVSPGPITRDDILVPYHYTDVKPWTIINITMTLGGSGITRQYNTVINAVDVANQAAWDAFVIIIKDALFALTGGYTSVVHFSPAAGYDYWRIVDGGVVIDVNQLNVYGVINKFTGFKLGAWHKFAIAYYDDALRSGAGLTTEEMDVYVNFLTEDPVHKGNPYYNESVPYDGYVSEIELQIKNLAPKWATTYKILYLGSNIRKFVQYVLNGVPTVNGEGKLEVPINSLLRYWVVDNQPSPITYQFSAGDRLRLITNTGGGILDEYVDVRINALSQSGSDWILITDVFDFTRLSIGSGSLVEIYAVRNETDEDSNQVAYEFGYGLDVRYDQSTNSYYHEGTDQNQNPLNPVGTPAIVTMNQGDVYLRRRGYKTTLGPTIQWQHAVEDFNYSDFYPSRDINIGRVNVVSNTIRQVKLTNGLVHSNVFFDNTNINGMAITLADTLITINQGSGPICSMEFIGFTLKVLQATKNTSIYIGRREVQNQQGSSQLTVTDAVFGTIRPAEDDYGTTFPGSVYVEGRHMYFLDGYKGVVVRDSPNGMIEISQYGKLAYWREVALSLIKYQRVNPNSCEVIATFDEELGCYVISVLKLTEEATEIVPATNQFFEAGNRWKGELSYIPEMHGERGKAVVSFVNGQLWRHYENFLYNNFYGVQHRQKITVVANVNPNEVKAWDSISIASNKPWEATGENGVELNIKIPPCDLYPLGMESRLKATKFTVKEGLYHAEFMRSAMTQNYPSQEMALVNGDYLRGESIEITLENGHSQYTRLFLVRINATSSKLSK